MLLDQPTGALALLRRGEDGSSPERLVLIGRCLLETGGSRGFGIVQFLGVTQQPVADPVGALASFRAALRMDPTSPDAHAGCVTALISLGRFDEAEELARTAGAKQPYLIAVASEARLRSHGTIEQERAREIISILEDYVSEAPGDVTAQNRLATLHIGSGGFIAARRIGTAIGNHDLEVLAEWAELTRGGGYLDAHRKKLSFARERSNTPPSRTAKIADYVTFAQAVNYCDGAIDAAGVIRTRTPLASTAEEREIMSKVRADLALLCGDPARLVEFRRSRPTPNPAAEAAFRSMVMGRRVLVIGPAPNVQPHAATVEAADVVVTTTSNHIIAEPGQPQVTYVTDEAALLLSSDDLAQLEQERHRMIVVRPSILGRSLSQKWAAHPSVRTMQFEDSTPFLGTHFGVQRILYDLIAAGADSIEIAGVDFFLGEVTYKPGYQLDTQRPGGHLPLMNFSHDYAYGFRYTQLLRNLGFVRPHDEIDAILQMSVPTYLQRLEECHPDRPPGLAP
jgi:tetratricopeptide (TPR) repeat protein